MRKELPGYLVYRLKMGLPRRYTPRNEGGMDSCFRRNDIRRSRNDRGRGKEIKKVASPHFPDWSIGQLFATDKPTFILLAEGGNSHADAK